MQARRTRNFFTHVCGAALFLCSPMNLTSHLSFFRVIRTFELEDLEVRCWKYLVRSVTRQNCVWLHRLADAYDCPALKWEAWNVIKAVLNQFALQPMQVLGAPLEGEDEEHVHRFSNDVREEEDEEEEDSDDDGNRGGRSLAAKSVVYVRERSEAKRSEAKRSGYITLIYSRSS